MDQWVSTSDMQSKRCYVGAIILSGKLYAVGGYDGMTLLDSIECFDPATDEWNIVSSMGTSRCDMGVAVLVDH
jgi:kelch-like protein 12